MAKDSLKINEDLSRPTLIQKSTFKLIENCVFCFHTIIFFMIKFLATPQILLANFLCTNISICMKSKVVGQKWLWLEDRFFSKVFFYFSFLIFCRFSSYNIFSVSDQSLDSLTKTYFPHELTDTFFFSYLYRAPSYILLLFFLCF